MTDPIQIAIDQLTDYGLIIDRFNVDGKLYRVKTTDDKGSKKSGWYVAHEFNLTSGRIVISGRFGNWKQSNDALPFRFDATFTNEEKAAFKKQQEDQRRAAAKEKKARNKQAADRAEKAWPGLPTEGKSDYLARKKIHGFGCRYSRGSIAIPLYKNKKLVGLQWIDADGEKKFISGTEKEGASTVIQQGDPDLPDILCEGYSTGCTVAMAKPTYTVRACHDAGNLLVVAKAYIKHKKPFMVAADNDHQLAVRRPDLGNKGLSIADQIKRLGSDIPVYWPEFSPDDEGSDFNDIHVTQGLDAVKAIFDRPPQAFPANFLPKNKSSGSPDEPVKMHSSDYSPPEPPGIDQPDPDWVNRIQRNDKGGVLGLASNVNLILENHSLWNRQLAYCDFSYKIIKRTAPLPDMVTGEWDDADSARMSIWLSNTFKFEPARQKLSDGLVVAAQRNRFHPVRDYLESITWDGTPRIDNWLEDIFEATAQGEGYLQAVGSKFLIGAVARIMKPGCKMDNVMILEGVQGLKKSTSIGALFGEWFSDAPIPIGDKDAYQNIQGVWCSELAELDSFNKAESTSAKLFFSQVRDRYRPSYGQHAQDFPRQTIFVGTTNQGEYLKDYTGNRRYWPVKCFTVKLDLLHANRDQYWAEALHRFKAGETWWPDDASREAFEAEQDERMQLDPWHYPIEDWIRKQTKDYFQADDLLCFAIGKDLGAITRADQNRISPIMKKLGYKNTKMRIPIGGKKVPRNVYVHDDMAKTEELV